MTEDDIQKELELLSKAVEELEAIQSAEDKSTHISHSLNLRQLNKLARRPAPPEWEDVDRVLNALYGSNHYKDGIDPDKVQGGISGVALAAEVLRRVELKGPSFDGMLLWKIESLVEAVKERTASYRPFVQQGGADGRIVVDPVPASASTPARSCPNSRSRSPAAPPPPSPDLRAHQKPVMQAADLDEDADLTPIESSPEASDETDNASDRHDAEPVVDNPGEEEEEDFVPRLLPGGKPFFIGDRSTWFDETVPILEPPDDLPRSHDGLSIFDVPFGRQLHVGGKIVNEIGGNQHSVYTQKTHQMCLNQDWQPLPLGTGEMFVRFVEPGVVELDNYLNDGTITTKTEDGEVELQRVRPARPMSTFFRHDSNDWRYIGEAIEYRRTVVTMKHLEYLKKYEPEVRRRWDEWFASLEEISPKFGFHGRARRGGLVFATFNIVSYDVAKIRGLLDKHEETAMMYREARRRPRSSSAASTTSAGPRTRARIALAA